jgi:NitT/TauT family transport system substrate-binding protein
VTSVHRRAAGSPRVALLAALLAVTACRRDAPRAAADAAADAPRKLRVAITPHLSSGPLLIAQAEGFFRDEGLDVEFVSGLRTEESLAALITGDIDVRTGPLNAGLLSAIAQGAPLRITAGQGQLAGDGCTYFAIVVRSSLDTSHVRIRRMRTSQDGVTRYIVSRMLAPHHVRLDAIETIRLPEAAMTMSLERGSIDAVAVSEPALTRTSRVGRLWIRAQDVVPGFQWGVVSFGERLLRRDREAGRRFIRAYQRGVAQYRQGKTDRNVAIISAASGDPDSLTREVCWPSFTERSDVNWASVAEFQRWANTEGLMEHTLGREQVWDSTFVTASAPRTGATSP